MSWVWKGLRSLAAETIEAKGLEPPKLEGGEWKLAMGEVEGSKLLLTVWPAPPRSPPRTGISLDADMIGYGCVRTGKKRREREGASY